jgi:hypothetical protein
VFPSLGVEAVEYREFDSPQVGFRNFHDQLSGFGVVLPAALQNVELCYLCLFEDKSGIARRN